ncbi:hypothetical protein EIP91_003276 [Steccherinum ochraceum]|uniref:DUF3752 domain-containing protein n=1 Tax=Steccherinum ochraceum TaxID=92696 RepID=A0A4R0RRJ5_9APHY|nr:hypothetical protein EIP91_003276 [Steccherinum ochraceum]
MAGPVIPAHLLESKIRASSSIEAEESEAGPSAPTSIGPTIPAHFLPGSSAPQPDNDEEEEEDDYAPALPPDLLAARTAGPSAEPVPKGKLQGPALPPGMGSRYDDSDDDDVGPQPLPQGVIIEEKSGVRQFLEREERRKKLAEPFLLLVEAAKPKALQREEWMLVPPSSSDLLSTIDPTKLNKPRQFARTAAPVRSVDTSLWTETPAERQQRLADEVAGKRRRAEDLEVDLAERGRDGDEVRERDRKRRRDAEIRAGVDEHTRKNRGGTLVAQHSTKSKDDTESDGPPVLWDHSRDMALSGRLMDDKSREKMIKDARGLGDRFGAGKSGSFL